jgi:hypothetical protein
VRDKQEGHLETEAREEDRGTRERPTREAKEREFDSDRAGLGTRTRDGGVAQFSVRDFEVCRAKGKRRKEKEGESHGLRGRER